jgi:hypothetical protein
MAGNRSGLFQSAIQHLPEKTKETHKKPQQGFKLIIN